MKVLKDTIINILCIVLGVSIGWVFSASILKVIEDIVKTIVK